MSRRCPSTLPDVGITPLVRTVPTGAALRINGEGHADAEACNPGIENAAAATPWSDPDDAAGDIDVGALTGAAAGRSILMALTNPKAGCAGTCSARSDHEKNHFMRGNILCDRPTDRPCVHI